MSRTQTADGTTWVRLPAAVLRGVAAVLLRALAIVTVFIRQLTEAVDEFVRILAEGESTTPRTAHLGEPWPPEPSRRML